MSRSQDKRRQTIVRWTMVLAVLGMLLCLLWWVPWSVPDVGPGTVALDTGSPQQPSDRAPRVESPSSDMSEPPQPAPNAEPPAEGITPSQPEAKSEAEQRLVLEFREKDGAPVSNWRFRYELLSRADMIAESREDELGPDTMRSSADGEATTDTNGNVELLEGRDFRGFKVIVARLTALDTTFTFAGQGGYSDGLSHGQHGLVVPEKGGAVRVPMSRERTVSFTIQYADGQPYEGRVGVSSPVAFGQATTVMYAAGQVASVKFPVVDSTFRIGLNSDRTGFAARNSWRFNAATCDAHLLLTIDEDSKQCQVAVDLGAWPSGEQVKIIVRIKGTGIIQEDTAMGGEQWQTVRVGAWGIPFSVEVRGTSGMWRSEDFLLQPSETKKLDAVPAKLVRVRARFLDPMGRPVRGACINAAPTRYPDWARYKTPDGRFNYISLPGLIAFSDADGVAELVEVPEGIEVELEALGHEIQRRKLEGRQGDLVDLGDIRLAPAVGRVEVTLLNRRPEVGYRIKLMGLYGSGDVAIESDIRRDVVVFDKLPIRTYQLVARAGYQGNGGPVPNPIARFEDSEVVRAEIDVSGWLTLEERRRAENK